MRIEDKETLRLPMVRTFSYEGDWPPPRRALWRERWLYLKAYFDIGSLDEEDKALVRQMGLSGLYRAVVFDAILALIVIGFMALMGLVIWHLVT